MSNHTNSESQLEWSPLIRYCCLPTMAKSDDCLEHLFSFFSIVMKHLFLARCLLPMITTTFHSLLCGYMWPCTILGLIYFSRKYLFIWLHQVLVTACRIKFPDQGLNLGPLHWKLGVLATGPPANFLGPISMCGGVPPPHTCKKFSDTSWMSYNSTQFLHLSGDSVGSHRLRTPFSPASPPSDTSYHLCF